MKLLLEIVCLGFFFTTSTTFQLSSDWPDYRGPQRDGIAADANLPLRWSEGENVRWKTAIHGRGWSSPVVHGNQVWLTTATGDGRELSAICVDRDSGRILLDRKIFEVAQPRPLGNPINTYATPSPTIEEGRVYLHFGSYGTAAIDTSNFEEVWRRQDLPCDHWRGPASSPLLWDDLLIFHMDGANVQYVVALDKRNGQTRWVNFRSADYGDLGEDGRPLMSGDFRKAYNTPIVIDHNGERQLISPSAKAVYSYQPQTGRELWRVRHDGHSSAARTLYSDGLVAVNTGYMGSTAQMWGIRVDGQGDVTDTHVIWKFRRGVPRRSSPVLIDGRVYMVADDGVVSSIDFKSGRELWKGRLPGSYSASLIYASGRLHFFNEEGLATIAQAGDSFNVISSNQLDSGFMASPAVAGDAFFLRTKTHLYRIE